MIRVATVAHRFVDVVPDTLDQGVVYVCIPYTTAVHLCLCGCGEEVITPIKPTGWKLGFNGVAVSLSPSIGNWSIACRSHYWITDGRIRWASQWHSGEVALAREHEDAQREMYFASAVPIPSGPGLTEGHTDQPSTSSQRWPAWLRPSSWMRRRWLRRDKRVT